MDTRSQSLIIIDPPPEGEAEPNRLYVSLHAPLPPWASEANRTFMALPSSGGGERRAGVVMPG